MIVIKRKSNCCGCNLCATVCPKKCIQMVPDEEGFWYPQVDKQACINCGRCEHICPILNKKEMSKNEGRKAYAAIHSNEEIRLASSSGGIFTAIAEKVIDRGGVVFGAAFNKNFEVEHTFVEQKEALAKFRGSKYVQSKMGDIYLCVLEFLKSGRPVLFSGTPCQVAALKAFLGRNYDNLMTVDLICHGVPSPLVWKKYVEYRKSVDSVSELQSVSFRDKQRGGVLDMRFTYYDGTVYQNPPDEDPMHRVFLQNLCLRPSCYDCAFCVKDRQSDITLADFWGIANVLPNFDDGKGVSLVVGHSSLGKQVINDLIRENIINAHEVDYEKAILGNSSMTSSVIAPLRRNRFMKKIAKTDDFIGVANKFTGKKSAFRQFLGKIRRRLLLIIRR